MVALVVDLILHVQRNGMSPDLNNLLDVLNLPKYLEIKEYFSTEGKSLGDGFQIQFITQIRIYRLKIMTMFKE